jgi:small nuclear ribonucleoprotein (snRNP)-like protein
MSFRKPIAFIIVILTLLLIVLHPADLLATAAKDSMVLKNGDIIVGEIKSLDKGVLTVETDYSDQDFKIEWSGVKEIYCATRFLITLKSGDRYTGSLQSADSNRGALISGSKNHKDTTNYQVLTSLGDVVYLKGLKSDFWSRAYASIDIGLTLTRANNLKQLNGRTNFGYLADKWSLDLFYNDLRSSQDSILQTRRTEGGAGFNYYLQHDWYTSASLNFLANTEQALELRTTYKVGMGKFIIHTNKRYWSAVGGVSYNNETFSNKTPGRKSMEGYFGSELNLFDVGDLSLFNSLYVYPSFTEGGRWRSDFKLDTKYKFLEDFYLKLGLTYNYDNQPAVAGKESDYVFSVNVGWEL